MNDKKFLIYFFLCVISGMILFSIAIYSLDEMKYFDGEYPAWIQQKNYTHTKGNESQILFLGDSAFKAAIFPELIAEDAYNLSLGGAGPIEMYYSFKNYLANHPKPQKIFISFGPMHFIYLDRYRDRTLYFHFLNPNEQIESQINIFKFRDVALIDMPMMLIENLQFLMRFPTKYFQTIKMSELKRDSLNQNLYEKISLERGHMLFGNDPNWFNHYVPHEQLQVDFKLLNVEDFYMRQILKLCNDNKISVKIVQAPINQLTYQTASEHNYFQPYFEYLRSLSNEFDVEVETELIFYDLNLFGESLHLNEEGAEIYTRYLKSKYNI